MKTLILVYLMFLGGLIFGQTVPLAIRFDSIPVVHFEALDNERDGMDIQNVLAITRDNIKK